jgi:hypothetical protein
MLGGLCCRFKPPATEADMTYYLVTANPRSELMGELEERLQRGEFLPMRPFGQALTHALKGARLRKDGSAVWEEEDYCSPPLAMEREAVLDRYFDGLEVEPVAEDKGWQRIASLPRLFPALA